MPKKSQDKNILDNIESFIRFANGIDDFSIWVSNEKGAITYSDSINKITGYTSKEINRLPDKIYSIIFEDDVVNVKNSLANFLHDKSRNVLQLKYRIVRKDNSVSWVKESITKEGNTFRNKHSIKGVMVNISELQEEIFSQKKLVNTFRDLNDAKDKFISILSHDLRAPFTSILGFAEILLNEPNLSKSEQTEFLNYISDSSQNQLQLINYLLDWSRLQTGRLKLEPVKLNAQTTVYNCISSLTGNSIRKNIDIQVNIKNSLFVLADERLLMQVINNLLSNAIKFSNQDETVEISADIFSNGLAEFIIKDNGMGISEENKNKIFKVEKSFSTEGTNGEKGTGLGLSLVKEIVEKHGGSIWFYSELGKGSEFHFTIPCTQKIILIVADNPIERKNIEKIIKEGCSSYKLLITENGYEALEFIMESPPSLIIVDQNLPLMSGLHLIETIRKEDRNFRIPIFAIVQKISEEVISVYQSLGVDELFQKPVDLLYFSDVIQKKLN